MANPFHLVLLMTGLSYPDSPAFKSRFGVKWLELAASARWPVVRRSDGTHHIRVILPPRGCLIAVYV